jgi:hypothetical protein
MRLHGPLGEALCDLPLRGLPMAFSAIDHASKQILRRDELFGRLFPSLVVQVPLPHAELWKGQ